MAIILYNKIPIKRDFVWLLRDAGGRFLFGGALRAFDCFPAAPLGSRFFFGRAFLEFFYATSRVYKFLFARIKRMTLITEFYGDFFHRGAGGKRVTAGAGDFCFRIIGWMDVGFHEP